MSEEETEVVVVAVVTAVCAVVVDVGWCGGGVSSPNMSKSSVAG